jgi:exodeoxyribonuclease V alpha subunit
VRDPAASGCPDGDEPADKDLILRAGAIRTSLDSLLSREQLVAETVELMGTSETAIYTPSIHTTEKAVAERVNTLLNSPWRSRPKPAEIDAAVEKVQGYDTLSDEQQQAVRRALSEPLLVLTGGPGTGKTTTTRVIVAALENLGKRLQLASPTGRAAKRAAEVTGREAKTIHRMLAFDPEKKGFKHGPGEPLELDILIVDESSMLDLTLTHHTLRAVPDGAQVIFVGDVDQLPSVGPGNVLADLINSGRVPVARLTQVFRQAAQSKIITNAHAINKGKMPELPPPSAVKDGADCVFVEVEDPEEALDKIRGIVAKSLPRLGFKPEEITVLSPMQRGSVGARNLNDVLQAVMNPPAPHKDELQRGAYLFRVGDRVMQRRNNYDKNVFNGDVGTIVSIDKENQTVGVHYPEQDVEYDFADVDELNHALSCTIHKSQGSEYPACVIAVHNQHYVMLQRNLVYTALTRAKKIAVFVGTQWAIKRAVQNKHVQPRNTRLAQRLQRMVEDLGPLGRKRAGEGGRPELPTPTIPGRLFN